MDSYARIAVFRPIPKLFDYSVSGELQDRVKVGSICSVPFRGERVRGVAVELSKKPSFSGEKKPVSEVISDRPLSQPLMDLARWISHRTLTPLGQVFHRMVPADLTVSPREKKVIELTGSFAEIRQFIDEKRSRAPKQVEILECLLTSDETVEKNYLLERADSSRSPLNSLLERGLIREVSLPELRSEGQQFPLELDLTEPASDVLEELEGPPNSFVQLALHSSGPELLGSYSRMVELIQERGTVLFLTSDVGRARWFSELFRRRLDLRVLTYHSGLTRGEQSYRWNTAKTGSVDVFVGVLNAVYLPVPDLGGIVIDDEGDRNYELKEQDPKGNLVEIALKRGELEERPVLYSGVAPSIRSYYETKNGSLNRPGGGADNLIGDPAKGVEIRVQSSDSSSNSISEEFKRELRDNYEKEEPAMIIGERAGPSSAALCDECGSVLRCPECRIPLAYSSSGRYGVCPYCGFRKEMLVCDNCGSEAIRFIGGGLEAIENELSALLPNGNIRVFNAQAESDRELSELFRDLLRGNLDVLLGTRSLLTPFLAGKVPLLGLLDLDILLNRPTYRSTEFLFRRILKGANIVGPEGKLFLQGLRSEQLTLRTIASGRWRELYENELESRRRMNYPPHGELVEVSFQGRDMDSLEKAARSLKEKLEEEGLEGRMLGPMGESSFGGGKPGSRSRLMVKTDDLDGFLSKFHSVVNEEDREMIRLNPYS